MTSTGVRALGVSRLCNGTPAQTTIGALACAGEFRMAGPLKPMPTTTPGFD
jgi:hypothetical protein